MADAVAGLGSRHGIMVDPIHKKCGIIRLDQFAFLPELTLRAGAVINGKEYILPLAPGGEDFMFLDQRISPCTTSLMGIHPESALKVKLTLATPFRPRDIEFSVTPVIGLRLEAESLLGHFRWTGKPLNLDEVELFVEFGGKGMTVEDSGKASVDLLFSRPWICRGAPTRLTVSRFRARCTRSSIPTGSRTSPMWPRGGSRRWPVRSSTRRTPLTGPSQILNKCRFHACSMPTGKRANAGSLRTEPARRRASYRTALAGVADSIL